MNGYFTPGPPEVVYSIRAGFLQPVPCLSLQWWCADYVARKLDNPYALMQVGQFMTQQQYIDDLVRFETWYLGEFNQANNTPLTALQLAQQAIGKLMNILAGIPADQTSARKAGTVADNLGALNFTDGVPDLSKYPTMAVTPAPTQASNIFAAPKIVAEDSATGWYRPGFRPYPFGYFYDVNSAPNLPSTWEEYAAQLVILGKIPPNWASL